MSGARIITAFTHQDPGFVDHVVNKKAEVMRVYLPPDANCLEGTITTPFDMTVLNDLDRFHLVMDTIDRLPQTGDKGIYLKQQLQDCSLDILRRVIPAEFRPEGP